jgi:hypothetical protein
MRPVLLTIAFSAGKVSDYQAAAEEHDCTVKEDFQALIVAKMEAGDGDIPEETEDGATQKHNETGKIFGTSAPVSGLVIVRTHKLRPSEK